MKKTTLFIGIILVLLGVLLAAMQLYPALNDYIQWPMILIGLGLLFLAGMAIDGNGDLAIPGLVNAGLGGIFLYQMINNDWESWSYVWTLIPGFVGLGILLANLVNRERVDRGGIILVFASGVGFTAFYAAYHYENVSLEMLWPLALILVGVIVVVQALSRNRANVEDD
ncbi:MAG TPA: hypothetical protein ENN32_05760 [Chloroflexi bacterium]|nr:hypothetical protein [Chloroflexota bacterium]